MYKIVYKHHVCGATMDTLSYEPQPPVQYHLHECKDCNKWLPAAEFTVLECVKVVSQY